MPLQPSVQRWTWVALATALWFAPALSAQAGNFSAHLTAAPASYQGICPGTIKFSGEIRATQPGKVQFQYIRSDGAPSPVQTLLFGSAGSKPLSTTWTLGSPSPPLHRLDRHPVRASADGPFETSQLQHPLHDQAPLTWRLSETDRDPVNDKCLSTDGFSFSYLHC